MLRRKTCPSASKRGEWDMEYARFFHATFSNKVSPVCLDTKRAIKKGSRMMPYDRSIADKLLHYPVTSTQDIFHKTLKINQTCQPCLPAGRQVGSGRLQKEKINNNRII
jgi:hypothetical protein